MTDENMAIEAGYVVQALLESEFDLVKAETNRAIWMVRALSAEGQLSYPQQTLTPYEDLMNAVAEFPEDDEVMPDLTDEQLEAIRNDGGVDNE
jgi:hypothetical protein